MERLSLFLSHLTVGVGLLEGLTHLRFLLLIQSLKGVLTSTLGALITHHALQRGETLVTIGAAVLPPRGVEGALLLKTLLLLSGVHLTHLTGSGGILRTAGSVVLARNSIRCTDHILTLLGCVHPGVLNSL